MRPNPRQEAALAAEGWLTVPAAAELAQVGTSTIYRWLDGREIEERRVGSRRYVSRASVLRAAGQAPETTPTSPADPAD